MQANLSSTRKGPILMSLAAFLVFRADDSAIVEAFVDRDPYVKNRLVKEWRIRPWTVVIGAETDRS